jgi:hypothetical protein
MCVCVCVCVCICVWHPVCYPCYQALREARDKHDREFLANSQHGTALPASTPPSAAIQRGARHAEETVTVLSENRSMLRQNLEKLDQLEHKSARLAKNSAAFLEAARMVSQKQGKNSSW